MLKFLLAVHLVLVVFAIGPLVHAATTASRGVRRGDGVATASAARMLRIYAYASVLVVIAGMGLMSQKRHTYDSTIGGYRLTPTGKRVPVDFLLSGTGSEHVAEFSDVWIWLSLVLWLLAMAVVLGVLVPTLNRVTKLIEAEDSVITLTARVAAAGGIVALMFLAIVVIMVYKPGS
jgi:hypothetical protein